MTDDLDKLLDDVFLGCAFAAWLHEAAACGGWPDSEATRERAYRYFEEALAEKHAARVKGKWTAQIDTAVEPVNSA